MEQVRMKLVEIEVAREIRADSVTWYTDLERDFISGSLDRELMRKLLFKPRQTIWNLKRMKFR